MKEEKGKTNLKNGKKIKILVCTLVVFLIATIAIFGIYTKYQNRMINNVKSYSYGMDLKGERTIILTPSTETETKIKDAEGNEVTDAENLTDEELTQKGYTKEEVAVNSESALTKENYEKSKEIIEKRLKQLDVEQYTINVNEENGQITINIPEDNRTDDIINNLIPVGKFEIIDSETKEVLMTNNDIKEARVMYGQSSSVQNGTNVYLDIKFNKEGTQKFENVTNTYKTVEESNTTNTTNTTSDNTTTDNTTTENNTNETNTSTENTTNETEGSTSEDTTKEEETQKEIIMQIDGEQMMTTSFDEVTSSRNSSNR